MKTSPSYMEGKYFILPNDIFSFSLSANAIAVYAYLMRLEDRKTNVCWAKQQTIGSAVRLKSPKTVAKALTELEDAELIYREPTTMNHNGKRLNGVQLFTIRPVEDAKEHLRWTMVEQLSRASAAQKAQNRIEKYNEMHPDKPISAAFTESAC